MIEVHVTTHEFDVAHQSWIEVPVAELVADGQEVTLSGPHADWISLDISIVDPETGERIARDNEAERWARLLPFAYRDGDLSISVTEVAEAEPAAAAFRYSAGV
jgi:hypothetical protein